MQDEAQVDERLTDQGFVEVDRWESGFEGQKCMRRGRFKVTPLRAAMLQTFKFIQWEKEY